MLAQWQRNRQRLCAVTPEPDSSAPMAWSYTRVSSGQQLTGGGLNRQDDMAVEWCKRNGFALDTELDLADRGRSAYKGDHLRKGALGEFLRLAQQGALGDAPVLLIEAVDRLSRQEPLDALQQVVFALVKEGVRIIDLEDGRTYDRESLAGDALVMLVLKAKAAHDYSKRLGRRLASHWDQARDGFRDGSLVHRGGAGGGRHPFWLSLNPGGTAWEFNEHAESVRVVLQLIEVDGMAVTAKKLNQRGIRTHTGKDWRSDSVQAIASDPATAGTLRLHQRAHLDSVTALSRWQRAKDAAEEQGQVFNQKKNPRPEVIPLELIPDFYPALIDRETFDRITQTISARAHSPKGRANRSAGVGHSFLQGLLTCNFGGSMGVTTSTPKRSALRRYFRCRRRLDGRKCDCGGRGFLLEEVHAHVATRLSSHLLGSAALPGEDREHEHQAVTAKLLAAELLVADAIKAVGNAEAKLEWAIDQGTPDMVLNVSGLLEKRRTAQKSAEARLEPIRRELRLIEQRKKPLASLVGDSGSALLRSVYLGSDTHADRQRLHDVLEGAGLEVVLEGQDRDRPRVGMRFGSTEDLAWEPLAGAARLAALMLGMVNPAVVIEGDNFIQIAQSEPSPEELEEMRLLGLDWSELTRN